MISSISFLTFSATTFGIYLGIATGFCFLGFGFGWGAAYLVGTSGGGKALITFDFLLYVNLGTGLSNNDCWNDLYNLSLFFSSIYIYIVHRFF